MQLTILRSIVVFGVVIVQTPGSLSGPV